MTRSNLRTVLVVDDEPAILTLIESVLKSCGCSVIVAPSGHLGIAAARSHPGAIDLLLSDFNMPDMDGFELACTLKRERPELRVLLMSGKPPEKKIPESWQFLAKPFHLHRLRTAVEQMTAVCN